jgi:lambda family phage tail tape measure protein
MSQNMGTVSIAIEAAMAGFESDMGRAARIAEKDMRKVEREAKRMEAQVKRYATAAGVAIAGAMTAAAVAIGKTIDQFDAMGKAASRMGITVEALSRLEYAARLSDVSTETLSTSLRRLGQVQIEVARGSKEQASLFRQLGVAAVNSAGGLRDADVVLRELADRFATMPDSAEKTALAVKLFGRSGAELIPLLNLGAKGLEEYARRSDEVGYTLDSKTTDAAQRFNDKMSEVRMAVEGMWRQAMPPLIDKLDDMADTLNSDATRQGLATVAQGLVSIAVAAVNATAAIGNLAGKYTGWLADQGFMPANASRDMDQLEARRAKLLEGIRKAQGSPLFYGAGTADKLRAELKEVEGLIKGFPFRGVSGKATGGWEKPLSLDFTLPPTGGGGKGSKGREAPDFAKDAARELQQLVEAEARAREAFEGMAARLAGPLADAAYRFSVEQAKLNELAREGGIEAGALAEAQDNLRASYERNLEAIQAQLTPAQQMISDMEFELRLIGLSNVEREKAIALRWAGADATEAEREAIGRYVEDMERAREVESYVNGMKSAFVDFGVEALSNFNSVADAAEQFADRIKRMALQLLMEKAVQWLFNAFMGGGNMGSAGGASQVSWIKGGYSEGGYTGSGGKYEPAGVVHRGEYVINAESTRKIGRGFLDRLNGYAEGGLVGGAPAVAIAGGGDTFNLNTTVQVTASGSKEETRGDANGLARRLQAEMVTTAKRVLVEERRQGGLLWKMEQGV